MLVADISGSFTDGNAQASRVRQLLQLCAEAFHMDGAMVLLADEHRCRCVSSYASDSSSQDIIKRFAEFARSDFIANHLICDVPQQKGEESMCFVAPHVSEHSTHAMYSGLQTLCAFPLFTPERLIVGVLVICDRKCHPFETDDQNALWSFADVVSHEIDCTLQASRESLKVGNRPDGSAAPAAADTPLEDPFAGSWMTEDVATGDLLDHVPWALSWNEPYPCPPISAKDKQRLERLLSYDMIEVDEVANQLFSGFCKYACALFDTPSSTLTVLDGDTAFLPGTCGFSDLTCAPRSESVCNYTVKKAATFVVHDMQKSSMFVNHPYVSGKRGHLRFYAGTPLLTSDGYALGALCVVDTVPRPDFGRVQARQLEAIACVVMHEMEIRKARLQRVRSLESLNSPFRSLEPAQTKRITMVSSLQFSSDTMVDEEKIVGVLQNLATECSGYFIRLANASGSVFGSTGMHFGFDDPAQAVIFILLARSRFAFEFGGPSHIPQYRTAIHHGMLDSLKVLDDVFYAGPVLEVATLILCAQASPAYEGTVLTSAAWRAIMESSVASRLRQELSERQIAAPLFLHMGEYQFESCDVYLSIFFMMPVEVGTDVANHDTIASVVEERVRSGELVSFESARQVSCSMLSAPRTVTPDMVLVSVRVPYWNDLAAFFEDPAVMVSALNSVLSVVTSTLRDRHGYLFDARPGEFDLVFGNAHDAMVWHLACQTALFGVKWDPQLLAHPVCASSDECVNEGLRLSVGMADGSDVAAIVPDYVSGRLHYRGPALTVAQTLARIAFPGQALVDCRLELKSSPDMAVSSAMSVARFSFEAVGDFFVKGVKEIVGVSSLVPCDGLLSMRRFKVVAPGSMSSPWAARADFGKGMWMYV
jgi:GAF domain-containing protein